MKAWLRRLLPGTRTEPHEGLRVVGDDHPKDAFFASPLRVTSLTTKVEELDSVDAEELIRVSFVATIKDAEGKRCPDMAVYARVAGPHRSATGMGHTSMLGQVTFRMSGPPGTYTCAIEDVAGGALGLDEASTLRAELSADGTAALA